MAASKVISMDNFWTQPRAISGAIIVTALLIGASLMWVSFRLARVRMLATPTCRKCKYNMSNLESLACPECGFTVKETGEWSRIQAMPKLSWMMRVVGGALLVYVLAMGYFVGLFAAENARYRSLSKVEITYPSRSWLYGVSPPAWEYEYPITPTVWVRPEWARVENPTHEDLKTISEMSALRELTIAGFRELTVPARRLSRADLLVLAQSKSLESLSRLGAEIGDGDVDLIAMFPALGTVVLSNTRLSEAGLRKLAGQGRPKSICVLQKAYDRNQIVDPSIIRFSDNFVNEINSANSSKIRVDIVVEEAFW